MDHLSEGRVEFGTGRGSSSAEWGGFAIPSAAETKPMWRESLEQIPRMWRDEPYAFEGKYFRMPERNVLPKPYSKPHPPMWVACSSPPTFAEAGELGLGALCFTFGTPDRDRRARQELQGRHQALHASRSAAYVNDNIAVTTNMFCLRRRRRGAPPLLQGARSARSPATSSSWLDSIPRPKGMPQTGPIPPLPDPTPAELQGRPRGRRPADRLARRDRQGRSSMYEELGVDQLIYAPLTLTLDQKHVLRSIETFGKHVLPALRSRSDPQHDAAARGGAGGARGIAIARAPQRMAGVSSSATVLIGGRVGARRRRHVSGDRSGDRGGRRAARRRRRSRRRARRRARRARRSSTARGRA